SCRISPNLSLICFFCSVGLLFSVIGLLRSFTTFVPWVSISLARSAIVFILDEFVRPGFFSQVSRSSFFVPPCLTQIVEVAVEALEVAATQRLPRRTADP